MLEYSVIGSPGTAKEKLSSIVDETRANELIVSSQFFDHQARLRSFELLADIIRPSKI